MEINEVKQLCSKAEEIFKDHFINISVTVKWDLSWKSHSMYGRCWPEKNGETLIQISSVHWNHSDREGIWNTICHELCHAYNKDGRGHGPEWRRIAHTMSIICDTYITRVGGSGSKTNLRKHDGYKRRQLVPVAEVECTSCHRVYPVYKRGGIYNNVENYWCSRCGKMHGKLILRKFR